jgi:hypothetical protein
MTVTAVVRDISHYNTISNYAALRAANDAFQIKVTEGTSFTDPRAATHYAGCAGKPRAPYHFARPVSIPEQVRHFFSEAGKIGGWERLPMLDCEFAGVTGAFIKALVTEVRRHSGIQRIQVYVGLHDILTTCAPATWWDNDLAMQVARYRKIGAPTFTEAWRTHLGFDHPGLTTYQWDNATSFYPGGPIGDISYDRVPLSSPISPHQERVNMAYGWKLPAHAPEDTEDYHEEVIPLTPQHGATSVGSVWVTLVNSNSPLDLKIAHWQCGTPDDHVAVPMLTSPVTVDKLGTLGGQLSPTDAYSLVVNYRSALGASLVIEPVSS